jgi:hypothetical protein
MTAGVALPAASHDTGSSIYSLTTVDTAAADLSPDESSEPSSIVSIQSGVPYSSELQAVSTQTKNEAENISEKPEPELGMVIHDGFEDRVPLAATFGCHHSVSHLPPLVTSPELDARNERLLNRFIEKGDLPHPEDRMPLIQYVQCHKVNAVCESNFVEAHRFQEVSQLLLHAIWVLIQTFRPRESASSLFMNN